MNEQFSFEHTDVAMGEIVKGAETVAAAGIVLKKFLSVFVMNLIQGKFSIWSSLVEVESFCTNR